MSSEILWSGKPYLRKTIVKSLILYVLTALLFTWIASAIGGGEGRGLGIRYLHDHSRDIHTVLSLLEESAHVLR